MTMTMAKAQEALKLFYLDGIQYQLNTANPILAMVERDKTSVVGSEIRMALRYGRNGGVGNRQDNGLLPVPNSRQTKQAKWETKNIFARIAISDKTVKASRSKDGAFLSLLEADLQDAEADAKDNMARQVYGNGTGKLATFEANASSTTLGVDNVQYFAEGQFIDVVNPSDGTVKVSQREVLVVDDVDNTITISGAAVTTDADDIAVIHGNFGEELTGFGSVFTPDNVLYGIDRTTNKWFNPTTKGVNGEISEVTIQQLIDDCERKAGGKINFLNSSYGVRRAYQELQLANKRIVEVMKLQGGFEALSYNNMPFTVDKYVEEGTLYGLDLSTWKLFHIEDWNWLDDDGAVLHRQTDRAVWEATLARYCDLGCNKPRGNFKATGIVEH
jgi:hypothetical protein